MAVLRDYITVDDVRNKLFNRFSPITREMYVRLANEHCEDLARKVGVDDPADISVDTHPVLREYLILYAISKLCSDEMNVGNTLPGVDDKYKDTFKVIQYQLQDAKKQCVRVVFTQDKVQTPTNRANKNVSLVRA